MASASRSRVGDSRGRRLKLGGVLGLAITALLMALGTPAAQAHKTCATHPSDPDALGSGALNTVACLRTDHIYVDVCDRDADGHYAYARVYYGSTIYSFDDTNGSAAGCSTYNIAGSDSYNICVSYEGCGTPVYWWQY